MRDRLIELIKDLAEDMVAKCGDECDTCKHGDCVGKLADHLLANGVIVPPMALGQTVWFIRDRKIIETKVDKIVLKNGGLYLLLSCNSFYETSCRSIGKTVFLTREEAEAALAERSEG